MEMTNRFRHKDKSLYIDGEYFCELIDGDEIVNLLNAQQNTIEKVIEEYNTVYLDKITEMNLNDKEYGELKEENLRLKKLLQLISTACSMNNHCTVKEILRDSIYGLDTVAGESANAWNDYVILSKFFSEYYGEHWDNYD